MAMRRAARYTLIAAAVLVVVVIALFLVVTRTDFGVEQAGRYALERIRSSVNGELTVGEIRSEGILRGITLYDVAIDDADGRPFLRADSARLAYHLRTILGGSISFDRLILHDPEVYIEKLPGQEDWNYERVFPGDTTTVTDTIQGEDLVLIDDATIVNGLVVVRFPWEPDGPVEPDDTARVLLEQAPGGLVRVLRFEQLDGRFPRIVWEAPEEEGKLIRIDELSARAYIWETPAVIERLDGTVTIRDSLLAFEAPVTRLPRSELSLVGTVILGAENRYDIQASGEDLAFGDFQWLYPRLPDDGGGDLTFRMQTQQGGNLLWLARNARLRTAGTQVAGSFGVVTGDTLYFTNVDLEASPLDLDLLQSLLPVELPLEGLLIGTVEVDGPISALRTKGDLVYRRHAAAGARAEGSSARWTGTLRARRPYAVSDLEADIERLDLEQVAALAPALRLRGVASGRIRANGSLERGLDLEGDLSLDRSGRLSTVRGAGRLALNGDRSAFDLRFDAAPVALEALAEQIPALERLAGDATGPVVVTGSLDDLRIEADLATAAGGLAIEGRVALTGAVPSYAAEGSVTGFRLDRLLDGLPETRVTGTFAVDGRGRRADELEGRLDLDVVGAEVEGIDVHRVVARLRAGGGTMTVDSLIVASALGDARAHGSFGLVSGRDGELQVALRADSLAPLEPLLLEPVIASDTLLPARARLAGLLRVDGSIRGSLDGWTARGRVLARDGFIDDVALARADAELEVVGGERVDVAVEATIDSLRIDHRFLPRARISGRHAAGSGALTLQARGIGDQQLELGGSYRLGEDGTWFSLARFDLDTRDGRWALEDTVQGRLGRTGLSLGALRLRRGEDGPRIGLTGALPWRQTHADPSLPASFSAEVANVPIGEILRVTQTSSQVDGVVTGRFDIRGTALSPVMEGAVVARNFRYGGAVLDSAGGTVAYRDRVLTGSMAGWRGSEDILRGDGAVPIELALTPLETRRLDRSMRLDLRADSVPAGLVSFLAPGFREVTGILDGRLVVSGTPVDPSLRGQLRLRSGEAVFEPANVRYRQVAATARIDGGTVLRIDGRVHTRDGGSGELSGTLDLARPADPLFDLNLVARGLQAARRRDVVAVADGRVHLGGRYSRPIVSGDLRITEGEMNLGELWRQYQIVHLDPSLAERFDMTSVDYQPDAESPFLANIQVRDATVRAERDFWLRSEELNVEVSGDLVIDFDRMAEDIRMTGVLQALRGSYDLQFAQGVPGRRFEIREGTVEFVGTPGIDPNLTIDAGYRVRRAQGDPIDVIAAVRGTLQGPRVQLTSESDLPLSEADLASYLLFGRSSLELSQSEMDIASQMRQGALSVTRPVLSGLASTQLHNLAASLGIGVDYLALSSPEYGWGDYAELDSGPLQGTQLEVGWYAFGNLFLVWSMPVALGDWEASLGGNSADAFRLWGTRVEWRFRSTWKGELFVEDRFARTPSFGLGEIDDRKVWGLSLLREWGY